MVGNIIEATLFLVALFLIVTNSQGFSTAIGATGSVYTQADKALQGR